MTLDYIRTAPLTSSQASRGSSITASIEMGDENLEVLDEGVHPLTKDRKGEWEQYYDRFLNVGS